jgi:hypothetical protein
VDLIARAILVTLSLALVGYGLVVWMDYGGATARLASTIAGEDAAAKLSPKLARWWGALPLLMGLAGLIGVLPLPGTWALGPVALVVAYYIVMMRLGWLFTPSERRAIGPAFWTRRAALVPLAAFFAWGGLTSILFALLHH